MKKAEVEIGGLYVVKVSGKLTHVRIDDVSPFGGWVGTNVQTGRQVRIRGAQRLRRAVEPTKRLVEREIQAGAAPAIATNQTIREIIESESQS